MCGIIDANVTYEVFGRKQTEAGIAFRRWLDSGLGRLVVGGRNLQELEHNRNFKQWFLEAWRREGRVMQVRSAEVAEQQRLLSRKRLKSNDLHVIALVLASGARLLYTNDGDLKSDFLDEAIVPEPEGRVYTTKDSKDLTLEHKELLAAPSLCRSLPPT